MALLTPPALMPVSQVTRPVLPDAEKRLLSPPEEFLAGLTAQLTPAQHAAFRAAFGDRADRILVLKVGNRGHAPADFARLDMDAGLRAQDLSVEAFVRLADDCLARQKP